MLAKSCHLTGFVVLLLLSLSNSSTDYSLSQILNFKLWFTDNKIVSVLYREYSRIELLSWQTKGKKQSLKMISKTLNHRSKILESRWSKFKDWYMNLPQDKAVPLSPRYASRSQFWRKQMINYSFACSFDFQILKGIRHINHTIVPSN